MGLGATAPRRGPALKTSSLRRKPQLDRIAESSSKQPSLKEDDLLQVCLSVYLPVVSLVQNSSNACT